MALNDIGYSTGHLAQTPYSIPLLRSSDSVLLLQSTSNWIMRLKNTPALVKMQWRLRTSHIQRSPLSKMGDAIQSPIKLKAKTHDHHPHLPAKFYVLARYHTTWRMNNWMTLPFQACPHNNIKPPHPCLSDLTFATSCRREGMGGGWRSERHVGVKVLRKGREWRATEHCYPHPSDRLYIIGQYHVKTQKGE